MNLQKSILSNYVEQFNKPTLKEISQHTGIQVTRVFRIFNGQEMKLSEYEVIKSKLFENSNEAEKLVTLLDDGIKKLGPKTLSEIYDYINHKIILTNFKHG